MLTTYKLILNNAIQDFVKKTKVDIRGITWEIVSENDLDLMYNKSRENYISNNTIKMPDILKKKRYGLCNIDTKTIFISKDAIQSHKITHNFDKNIRRSFPPYINKNEEPSILIRVIIDELAHIYTKRDHNTKEYEDKYNELLNFYVNACQSNIIYSQ